MKVKYKYELDEDKQIKVYREGVYLGRYRNFDEIRILLLAID